MELTAAAMLCGVGWSRQLLPCGVGWSRRLQLLLMLCAQTCKYLLPNALMLLEGNKVCAAQTLPQQLQLGREHAIAFFRSVTAVR